MRRRAGALRAAGGTSATHSRSPPKTGRSRRVGMTGESALRTFVSSRRFVPPHRRPKLTPNSQRLSASAQFSLQSATEERMPAVPAPGRNAPASPAPKEPPAAGRPCSPWRAASSRAGSNHRPTFQPRHRIPRSRDFLHSTSIPLGTHQQEPWAVLRAATRAGSSQRHRALRTHCLAREGRQRNLWPARPSQLHQ